MSMFESMVKECMEEASIPDYVVRKYARTAGAISYFYRFPGFLSTYDLIRN